MTLITPVLNPSLNIRLDGLKEKENTFILKLAIMLGKTNKFVVGRLPDWQTKSEWRRHCLFFPICQNVVLSSVVPEMALWWWLSFSWYPMSLALHQIGETDVLSAFVSVTTPLLSFKGALNTVYRDIHITQVFLLKFSTW